ncbi:helix-turn-helix domain-containing protein [Chloroflexota bacterium]
MIVTIEWEGYGPYGPQEIKKILESHYKNHLMVRRLSVETNKPEKLAYTAKEAASLLGISRGTIYSLIYQKEIPAIHYGKRWIIPKAALEKQLGGILKKERDFINEVDRADLLATADEALKLYDLLRGKLMLLTKNLQREQHA